MQRGETTKVIPITLTITDKSQLRDQFDTWKDIELSKENSKVSNFYSGVFLNELTCKNCNHKNYNFSRFSSIDLQLPAKEYVISLKSLLKIFFKPELIEDYKCDKCHQKCIHNRQNYIWLQPQILVFVFKRFGYSGVYGDSQKLENIIGVEHGKLHLKSFAFSGFEDLTNSGEFRVVGCINHQGGTNSGHYTS